MFTKESITQAVNQLLTWHKEGKKAPDGREFLKNNANGKRMLTTYAQKESYPVEFVLDGIPHVGTAQVSYSMNVIGVKPAVEAAGEKESRAAKQLRTRIANTGDKLSPEEKRAIAESLLEGLDDEAAA